jgi:hypothetical protein
MEIFDAKLKAIREQTLACGTQVKRAKNANGMIQFSHF